jgi:hypothetical protein
LLDRGSEQCHIGISHFRVLTVLHEYHESEEDCHAGGDAVCVFLLGSNGSLSVLVTICPQIASRSVFPE